MKRNGGFTLIEYLVALGVLGIFAAAFFSFFSISEMNYQNTGKHRYIHQIIYNESEKIYGGIYQKKKPGDMYKKRILNKDTTYFLSKKIKDKNLGIYSYLLTIRKKSKKWQITILNMEK